MKYKYIFFLIIFIFFTTFLFFVLTKIRKSNNYLLPSLATSPIPREPLPTSFEQGAQTKQLFVYKGEVARSQLSNIDVWGKIVAINTKLLTDPTVEQIDFNLPEGISYNVRKKTFSYCNKATSAYGCPDGKYTWIGEIENDENENPAKVTLVVNGSVVVGTIPAVLGVTKYQYKISGNEHSTMLFKVDPSKYGPD